MRRANSKLTGKLPETRLVFLVLIFLLFVFKGNLFLDPDFGWRLRAGEMYLRDGIPPADPFSYTMPSYPWVDHAWGLSLLIYILHSATGFLGLSFVFSFIALLSVLVTTSRVTDYFSDKTIFKKTALVLGGTRIPLLLNMPLSFKKLGFFADLPVVLATSILFTFFGVRVQIFSWLLLSLLLSVLFDKKMWLKWRLLLPVLFFVWANLHGSFAVGLSTFTIFLFLKSVRERNIDFRSFILLGVSIFITLINPYGVGVWREVWSSISDPGLRWQIIEWMPALTMFDLSMVFLIGLSGGLLLRYKGKFTLEEKGVFVFFLVQAISSRRHLPLWALVSIPIVAKGVYFVWEDAKKVGKGIERFSKVYTVSWIIFSVVFVIQALLSLNEAFYLGKGGFYPKDAVTYLTQNVPQGQVFSEYGWGGYLIWKFPEKKVFIDGRMPSWRGTGGNQKELDSAFDTYNSVLDGEADYKEVFSKFNIDTVLVSKPKKDTPLDGFYEYLEGYLRIFGWESSDFDFTEELERNGWKKAFENENAVIYKNSVF